MADKGYGRSVLSAVFRAGVSGIRPVVPVDPDELERARRFGRRRSPTSRAEPGARAPSAVELIARWRDYAIVQ